MGLDAVVIPFPRHAPGNAFRSSLPVGDERLILRVIAVLNAEMESAELGYETQARLYFYLGFQRYVMLRWLSLLPIQGHSHAWERRTRISTILQRLISPHILEHGTMDEQMYREMVIVLSGDMFALLRLARCQTSDCGPVGRGVLDDVLVGIARTHATLALATTTSGDFGNRAEA